MPSTSRGIPYPDDTGHTRLWEHLQGLAEGADDALGALLSALFPTGVPHIEYGHQTKAFVSLGTNAVFDREYFDQPFTAPPTVLCTCMGGGTWSTDGSNYLSVPTAQDVSVNSVYPMLTVRDELTGRTGTYSVGWIAIGI